MFADTDRELNVEKLKRHSRILSCYVKESYSSQKACLEAVELFSNEHKNTHGKLRGLLFC